MKLRPQLLGTAAALLAAGAMAAVHSSSTATADPALPTFTVAAQSPATHTNGTASVPVLLSCTDASYAFVDVRLTQLTGRQASSSIGSATVGCSTTPQTITVTVPNWYQFGSVFAVVTASGCGYGCGSGSASTNINVP